MKEARKDKKDRKDKPWYWLYRIVRFMVWVFSPKYRIAGAENLPEEACIIVGNHSQMFGPIAAEIYTPVPHETWCIGEMMHAKEVPGYAFQDFWSGKPKKVQWFYKILSYLIVPLSVLLFNNADTIPVYHDARIITTFRESVRRLSEGRSIVIFPECYDEHNNIVHEFQENFVDVAALYYKKTGKELDFVPHYVAPRLSKLIYGKPVHFHADVPIAEERKRICGELMDAVTEIAMALPEHVVVPYPNISRKDYPKNIPLEVYSHDTETC